MNHSKEGTTTVTLARTIGRGGAGKGCGAARGLSFALDVEPVELVEERRECIREAQYSLSRWERTRDELDKARLLAALLLLAAMVRDA